MYTTHTHTQDHLAYFEERYVAMVNDRQTIDTMQPMYVVAERKLSTSFIVGIGLGDKS